MKNIFYLAALLLFIGCQPSGEASQEMPTDLAGLRALQKEKKQELRSLSAEIESLALKIDSLDVNKVVQKKLVTTKVVEPQSFEHFTMVQGTIETDETASVSSEMGGRITALYIKEGQSVRKGALMAKTDMESVNKQLDELETQLGLAKDVYERQSRLWEQNIGSEVQYLQAKNTVERLEKTMETVRHQMTKANLYAPISGVVDMVHLKNGETAGPGMPIATILNTYQVKVVSDVPENYLGKIKRGEKVDIYFPALNKELEAKVSMLGRKIDPSNRTFKVEVNLSNRDGTLKPNLLAEMTFEDFQQDDVIVIPQAMVQQEVTGKEYVYVAGTKDNEKVAQKSYITTGESYDGNVIIEGGLSAGDEMIDEGALGLSENELITILNPTNEADSQ